MSVLTRWEGEDAFQVILRDLTDRKRAEAALRYQANLVEHVSDAIIGVDTDGRVESWNRAAELIYGVAERRRGRRARCTISSGCPPASARQPMRDVESVHRRHDGNLVIVRASVTHIFDDNGDQTGFVVVCADTTERRRAEDERRAVEQLHSTVIEAVDEGIIVADASGIVVDANPAARRILPLAGRDRHPAASTASPDPTASSAPTAGRSRAADHPVARALAAQRGDARRAHRARRPTTPNAGSR